MPRVVILIPHRSDTDYRDFWNWWWKRLQKPPDTSYIEIRGYSLVTMRNYLAEQALLTGAEWFFWLDDDLVGPDNVIEALLALNKPIAAGLYMAKKKPGERGLAAWQTIKKPVAPWDVSTGYMSILREQQGRFISVDVTGMGCVLIHRSVFEKVSRPWFVWDDMVKGPSEDFYFFEKVWREIQLRPVIDMECKFEHIGTFKLNVDGEFTPLEL